METIYLRIIKSRDAVIVAACDKPLLGKTFRQGKLKLEVSPGFYEGPLSTVEETLQALEAATIGNLVGEVVVSAAVERGLVNPDAIIRIDGIPHAQILKL